MRIGRLVLVVATLVTIMLFPLLIRDALQALNMPSAYAAANVLDAGGRAYQNGNFNDDDDDDDDNNENNDQSDNEDEDNDNEDLCFASLNSNEEVPCDFIDNDNGGVHAQPDESVNRPTKCFDNREVGVVQLGTDTYDATVTVMPHSSFGQTTRLTLREVDPSTVAGPPSGASLVDGVVFQLDAQSSCDGAAINPLPNLVNLGIVYNVPNELDKDDLQIVRLEGGSWVDVDTVPDPVPGNPYVSATIDTAGTYALLVES